MNFTNFLLRWIQYWQSEENSQSEHHYDIKNNYGPRSSGYNIDNQKEILNQNIILRSEKQNIFAHFLLGKAVIGICLLMFINRSWIDFKLREKKILTIQYYF